MTDVNTAFYQERQGQLAEARDKAKTFNQRLAAGKLIKTGPNTYRVNDPGSYDNGETWTYDKLTGTALPQVGLDTTLGREALAYKPGVPVWHSLGNPIPDHVTDVDDILDLGGVKFTVVQRPVKFYAHNGLDLALREVPGHFVNTRDDTWAPLGVVGRVYEPFQNDAAFRFAMEILGLDEGIVPETIGATRGGRRVFMTFKFPEGVVVDPAGINETIDLYLAIINSHDGSTLFQALVTPWLIVCTNTERFALRDAIYKWGLRHTRNANQKAAEARRNLGLTLAYQKQLAAEETKLAQNELLIDEFYGLVRDVYQRSEDETKRGKTIADNRETDLAGLYEKVAGRVGPTAYAAERAFTEYYDSKRAGLAARATAIMEDKDTEKKTRVHDKLMLRVK